MDLIEAKSLAERLLREFGLYDWQFKFDKGKVRFGQCIYKTKIISLSKELIKLNSFAQVNDTIRHEIAHALIGPDNGHNHIWKRKAVECGAIPTRCYSNNVIEVKGKYQYKCVNCGGIQQYHRKLKKIHACIDCCNTRNYGRYSYTYRLELVEPKEISIDLNNILNNIMK